MTKIKRIAIFVVGSALMGGLTACSVFQTYAKCGTAGCPGDAQVTAKTTDALRHHPGVEFWSIQAQCLNDVVYLYGLVDTNLERSIVEQVAFDASGGRKIVDSINVRANIR